MSLVDQIISEIDKGLKFSLDNYQKESRAYPENQEKVRVKVQKNSDSY